MAEKAKQGAQSVAKKDLDAIRRILSSRDLDDDEKMNAILVVACSIGIVSFRHVERAINTLKGPGRIVRLSDLARQAVRERLKTDTM